MKSRITLTNVQNSAKRERGPSRKTSSARSADVLEETEMVATVSDLRLKQMSLD
jgi:hypothetical protein